MEIWVDADATPAQIKKILFRLAERQRIMVTLVANVPLSHPASDFIQSVVVGEGFNVADDWITEVADEGDLVITADIPLAARVVEKGALALDPRGTLYTASNVHAKLATRNLLDELRGANLVEGGGPPPFTQKDGHKFAAGLQAFFRA